MHRRCIFLLSNSLASDEFHVILNAIFAFVSASSLVPATPLPAALDRDVVATSSSETKYSKYKIVETTKREVTHMSLFCTTTKYQQ